MINNFVKVLEEKQIDSDANVCVCIAQVQFEYDLSFWNKSQNSHTNTR